MPNIFISYRREDSGASAREIHARLSERFSGDEVFFDIRKIARGEDFVDVVTSSIRASQVLLAVIGRQWATVKDKHGRWRLGQPDDLVRLEIATALGRKMRVIPVLVDGASMPGRADLPADLAKLATLNAHEISHTRSAYDIGQLVIALGGQLEAPTTAPAQDFWGKLATSLGSTLGERLAGAAVPAPRPMPLAFAPVAPPAPAAVAWTDLSGEWRTTGSGIRHVIHQQGQQISDQTLNPMGIVVARAQGTFDGNQLYLIYEAMYRPPVTVRGEIRASVSPDGRLIRGMGFDPAYGRYPVELQRV